MLKITIIVFLFIIVIAAFIKPWIGAFSYIIVSVLSPQTIWYWGFDSIRFSYVIALAIFGSFIINIILNRISYSCWASKLNLFLLLLWIIIICSYLFGGYPPNELINRNLNSNSLLFTYCKIFVMYFLLQPFFDNIKNISTLIYGLIIVFAFYVYWANNQYFSGEMFSRGIRLTGPITPQGVGNYTDDNTFAMLFVMAIPFFFFMAQDCRNYWLKVLLYFLIPFAWHSVFLTGSRGGLVGLGVMTIYMFMRTKKKLIATLFAVGILAALYYQGGATMKSRSDMIMNYQKDSSAMDRIEAWEIAYRMCADWPFLGVGLGNFTVAWPKYSDSEPRVAHSTMIQFAAENGIFSGLAFLLIFLFAAGDLRLIRKYAKEMHASDIRRADHIISIANALEGACLGFFVCGLFLCLGTYEIFYYCIMLICLLKWHVVRTSCVNSAKETMNDVPLAASEI